MIWGYHYFRKHPYNLRKQPPYSYNFSNPKWPWFRVTGLQCLQAAQIHDNPAGWQKILSERICQRTMLGEKMKWIEIREPFLAVSKDFSSFFTRIGKWSHVTSIGRGNVGVRSRRRRLRKRRRNLLKMRRRRALEYRQWRDVLIFNSKIGEDSYFTPGSEKSQIHL